jgi:hypothetical protein
MRYHSNGVRGVGVQLSRYIYKKHINTADSVFVKSECGT